MQNLMLRVIIWIYDHRFNAGLSEMKLNRLYFSINVGFTAEIDLILIISLFNCFKMPYVTESNRMEITMFIANRGGNESTIRRRLLTEVSPVLVLQCSSMKGSTWQDEGKDWSALRCRMRKLEWEKVWWLFSGAQNLPEGITWRLN